MQKIKGEVSGDRQAQATIEIKNAGGRACSVDVVLDTGFTGYLTLPGETIRQLGLPQAGCRTFELASGKLVEFDAYLAEVRWHGRWTAVTALRFDSAPLLGMGLLWGSRMTMDAIPDGEVSIKELQAKPSEDKPDTSDDGGLWKRISESGFVQVTGVLAAIVAIALTFDSIPMGFSEIVTFMSVWLAIGAVLGGNKPANMKIGKYLKRRQTAIPCVFGFFIVILIAYAIKDGVPGPLGVSTAELASIYVLSFLSFAIGFVVGQDNENKR